MYAVHEAAFIVGVPPKTLHQWVYGREYKAKGEIRYTSPLITPANAKQGLLSFSNLAEAHTYWTPFESTTSAPRDDARAADRA
jgi:hypothetical protein